MTTDCCLNSVLSTSSLWHTQTHVHTQRADSFFFFFYMFALFPTFDNCLVGGWNTKSRLKIVWALELASLLYICIVKAVCSGCVLLLFFLHYHLILLDSWPHTTPNNTAKKPLRVNCSDQLVSYADFSVFYKFTSAMVLLTCQEIHYVDYFDFPPL